LDEKNKSGLSGRPQGSATVQAQEPRSPTRKAIIGALLLNPWFWLNYAATLLLTCWIPLLTIQVQQIMTPAPVEQGNTLAVSIQPHVPGGAEPAPPETTEDGRQVVHSQTRSVRVYEAYGQVAHLVWEGRFASRSLHVYLKTLGLHLALCFAISFWVWYAVLRTRRAAE
jgi:hypothetical protein